MEKIYTKNAPEAIGPYSQAIKVGNLVIPFNLLEYDFAADILCEHLCKLRIKAYPLSVFISVIHRSIVGYTDDKLWLAAGGESECRGGENDYR
jgi:hypothetical protein